MPTSVSNAESHNPARRILRKATDRIVEYVRNGEEDFFANTGVQDAVLFNLSAIAYASHLDSSLFDEVQPAIDLKKLQCLEDPMALLEGRATLSDAWQLVVHEVPHIRATLVSKMPHS